jgi:hypothetical protein
LVVGGSGVAGCGIIGAVPKNAGHSESVNLSLTTVPVVRSVTVSVAPGSASFANCGGKTSRDTRSTFGKLGFPNGRCSVGLRNAGVYPITITNTGIASEIFVNGTSAIPTNGGDQWSICNTGGGGPSCTRGDGQLPGTDQYLIENFSPNGEQRAGISATPACDPEFDRFQRCWAGEGGHQSEGIDLIGPWSSTNMYATKWIITVTWTPVPGPGHG